jgi:hypothetical protein
VNALLKSNVPDVKITLDNTAIMDALKTKVYPSIDWNFNHIIQPVKKKNPYGVKRIVFNDPATIVFWEDGTKTVVKCSENETFNPYMGFCAAVTKRVYGNNSRIQKYVKNGFVQPKPGKKPETVKPDKKKERKKAKNG